MNMYHLIIVVLLGVVTFLGFVVMQEHEESEAVPLREDATVTQSTEEPTVVTTDRKIPSVPTEGKILTMQNEGLTSVPGSVFTQVDAVELNLSNNKLEGSLPAEVRHLQSLRVLNLSNNNFTGVPAEIGQLSKLEVLNLSGNPITGLPMELGNLKNLKLLDLRGTDYSTQDLDGIRVALSATVVIQTD